ncbi:hypothetical protein PGT21_009367 [Puccinia graminis f. sp. tritici]|uniref:Uncharacterized protein n=1 Tax=Puccinia graminis f. sp. tritici TaxID=56615 RepID=A0A5B0QW91_PUCGR|nr:hypothetical protein PGT21_009522 [Puccinia graminis f. sp. tritici]KAA1117498.1 hypothetical protein PGT21_009367 [Puccinia graminis f. sp. tritici]KAA1120584.1 hypothetical protein PGTUg99_023258 [Puccinia graminis f. sp. tritici]
MLSAMFSCLPGVDLQTRSYSDESTSRRLDLATPEYEQLPIEMIKKFADKETIIQAQRRRPAFNHC